MLLSVIITCHDENLLVNYTLRSVEAALKNIKINEYEIIIHLDSPTDYLTRFFKKYSKPYKVFTNHFCDISQSRNFAISRAKGKYLFLIDGDDMISDTFIEKAITLLEKSKNELILYHPSHTMIFYSHSGPDSILQLESCQSKDDGIIKLFSSNRWSSSLIGSSHIFKEHSYPLNKSGYGFEDYSFNIATTYSGILHKIIPDTILFYRQREDSVVRKHTGDYATNCYMDAFSCDAWEKIDSNIFSKIEKQFSETLSPPKSAPKQESRLKKIKNIILSPFNHLEQESAPTPRFSDDFIKTWKHASEIDAILKPDSDLIDRISLNKALSEYHYVVLAYRDIIKINGFKKKKLIISSRAEKIKDGQALIINSSSNIFHEHSIINFGAICQKYNLDLNWQNWLLTRIFIQSRIKRISIDDSKIAYLWVLHHKNLINFNDYTVDIFLHEKTANRYISPYLVLIDDVVDSIIIDRDSLIKKVTEVGVSKEKIKIR